MAREAQKRWLDGDRQGAAELVPDEMVAQTNLLGTNDMVKERIRAYRHCGITTIRIDPEGEGMAGRLETLSRFMGLLDEVNTEAS